MDASIQGHQKMGNRIAELVWYEGTDALKHGEAVCYNTDYGTAADFDGRRANRVERPTTSNSQAFAGVAERDYAANSGGQLVEINAPGSKGVYVALGVDTVLDTGLLSFTVNGKADVGTDGGDGSDGGRFYTGKYKGRGSCIPRQTVTAVIEASLIGGWLVAADGKTLTMSDTTGLAAGDTVVVLGGEDDATDAVVPGKYLISSVTNGTVVVLATSIYDTGDSGANATGQVTGYAYTGNPRCQADLLTGDECGGIEFLNLPNAGGDSQPYMVGGVTYVCGGVTLGADADVELAQGTLPGETKAFILIGALASNNFVVDLATPSLQLGQAVGGTALAEIALMDTAADAVYLSFSGSLWMVEGLVGNAAQA